MKLFQGRSTYRVWNMTNKKTRFKIGGKYCHILEVNSDYRNAVEEKRKWHTIKSHIFVIYCPFIAFTRMFQLRNCAKRCYFPLSQKLNHNLLFILLCRVKSLDNERECLFSYIKNFTLNLITVASGSKRLPSKWVFYVYSRI